MGQMKRLWMELEGLADQTDLSLDFDARNYTDGAWWSEQDAEMMESERKDRMEALEIEAEIWELRSIGAM